MKPFRCKHDLDTSRLVVSSLAAALLMATRNVFQKMQKKKKKRPWHKFKTVVQKFGFAAAAASHSVQPGQPEPVPPHALTAEACIETHCALPRAPVHSPLAHMTTAAPTDTSNCLYGQSVGLPTVRAFTCLCTCSSSVQLYHRQWQCPFEFVLNSVVETKIRRA